jgi:hypothetical protein
MNIFISSPSYTIDDPKDGYTYYFDNSKEGIKAILVNPTAQKIRITLCLLYEYENNVSIETSKGLFILDRTFQELVLFFDNYWHSIGETNLVPYIDNSYKQKISLNLYNYAQIGSNIVTTKDTGATAGQDGKYKMDNLIFTGAPNYQARTPTDGQGAVLVFKKSSGNRFLSETIITEGFDAKNRGFQGCFGKHVKLLDMGNYDLLIVSASTKVRDNLTYNSVLDDVFGYFYVYSYRKNKFDNFYFHRETKIPFPSIQISKDFSADQVDEYLPFGTIYQMDTLKNKGFLVRYVSKNLFLYDLRDTQNVGIEMNQTLRPNYIKIFDSKVYLSYQDQIKRIDFSSNLWTDPSSVVFTNTYQVENFGSLIFPYRQGTVIGSYNDFFDFDLNGNLKKRITFGTNILSFDLFEDETTRKYFFLLNGPEMNVYILDQDYKLLLNDLYKEYVNDTTRLIRSDDYGESIFIGAYDHMDLENEISFVGMVANYDVFFERNNKTLTSLFPDFEIFNQVLIEEKTLSYQKYFYLEETFQNILPLISNRSNVSKNVEQIYPVINDTGIVLEMNYDVDESLYLSRYAKYFIYADPKHSSNSNEYSYILDSSNVYLGWSDNQMLSYNNSATQNEIYVYKKDNKIKLILLGIGSTNVGVSNKRWNIIESEMSSDPSLNYYDASMSLYNSLDLLQFVQFKKFTHNQDLIFLVHNLYSIVVIDYFTKNVYTKTFSRNIGNDLFYIDSFKNLFHLYSNIVNNKIVFYLSIYQYGYQNILLEHVKMDLVSKPYQIAAQYYNRAFVLLENYSSDGGQNGGSIVVRRFDIQQELAEKIEFEEVNISNEFNKNKHVVDIEFNKDTIRKLVLVNTSEKKDKIFQKTSQKIYTLPNLLKTKYQTFEKKYTRQLMVDDRNYVNYEQYQIKDEIPNLFYNINFQKYFNQPIGIYANYLFLDGKDLATMDEEKNIQLIKQNERSFAKYKFRPQTNYDLQTFIYDKENQNMIITGKRVSGTTGGATGTATGTTGGATGPSYLEIFDVSYSSYQILENGEATGISLLKKSFDRELCYETLDERDDIYISEVYNPQTKSITYWTFSKNNQFTPTSHSVSIELNTDKEACFHRTLSQEFIMDLLLDQKVVYFQKSGANYVRKDIVIPTHIEIEEPFDIEVISESFFILKNPNQSFLFVKNLHPSKNEWKYFGEQIYKLNTLHENTFELERFYFVDVDVSNNHLQLLQNVNINIQSPIFYDSENRFYCFQGKAFYKIDPSYLTGLLKYHSISSDGSTIYTTNPSTSLEKLLYFEHANQSISFTQDTDISSSILQFGPTGYNNITTDVLNSNGYFTLISDRLGVSKNYLFQPSLSRRFNTTEFPLIDTYQNVYIYESPILYQYKLENNQYVLDISKNVSNFEMIIDSDEKLFTNSKFSFITYKEIQYSMKKQFLNSPIVDIGNVMSLSPEADQLMIFQGHSIHLLQENFNNYPSKYSLARTIIPSNQFKREVNPNIVSNNFKVDWNNKRIFHSYATVNRLGPGGTGVTTGGTGATGGGTGGTGGTGATGATGAFGPRVSIFTWSDSSPEYHFHSDICGNSSLGFGMELSKDGKVLFLSEPNAPAYDLYKEGAIHIYHYDLSLNQFNRYKTLRSTRSKIGYGIKVSPSMDRIATFGYKRGGDELLELVIFYNLNDVQPKEISINADVFDMAFIGNTNTLFVEEKIFYESLNQKRTFYLIEPVNDCPNIITKVVLPNLLFENNLMMFDLTPFGKDYILFDGENVSHIIQIKDYMMNYIATQSRVDGSTIVISERGNTMITLKEEKGRFAIYGTW